MVARFGEEQIGELEQDEGYEHASGLFIHPYSDPNVIAGQGVCGLEIIEDLPDVETIIAPYGGGGLCAGIAAAVSHHTSAAVDADITIPHAIPMAPPK